MRYIIGCFKAIRKIIIHRIALYKAGKKLNVPLNRILKHDNSKFHPIEFIQYVKRFELGEINDEKWSIAWEHHWRNNDHHIEYWQDKALTFTFADGDIKNTTYVGGGIKHNNDNCKQCWIPDAAIREMIADWMAASYAYEGKWPEAPTWEWGNDNLIGELMKMEITAQPETSTRGFAVELLCMQNMITDEQIKSVLIIK